MRNSAKIDGTDQTGTGYGGFMFPWRLRRQRAVETPEAETTGVTREQIRALFSKELGLASRKHDTPDQLHARRIRDALYESKPR